MPTRILLVAWLLLPLASSSHAQGKSVEARIAQLEEKLGLLGKSSVEASTALQALRDLQRRTRELERLATAKKTVDRGYKALRAQLDDVHERLENLQLQLTAVSMHSAERARLVHDGGFALRAGRHFEMRLGGLLQAGYLGRLVSEERDYAGNTSLGAHSSELTLPRARVGLSGHLFDPRMHYVLGLEFGGRGAEGLLDAYMQFGIPRISVSAGLMRVPFGRQFSRDFEHLLFEDRAPTTLVFHPGRDMGLRVHGALWDNERFGRLGMEMGIFNGGGDTPFSDNNTDFLYVTRLVYEPLGPLGGHESDSERSSRPRLAVGGSFMFNLAPTDAAMRAGVVDPTNAAQLRDADGDGEVDNIGVYSAAAEVALAWRGLSVQGELFYRHEDPGAVAESQSYWGAYGQLAARHGSGLEAAARYSYWELHRFGEDGTSVAPGTVHELALALTAWQWNDGLKLQTSYAYRVMHDMGDRQGNSAADDQLRAHLLTVVAQVAW
ncbi:MAG: hypothetical protein JRH20_05545 [Deltaproteobacteria bacterium]|nr:hypothetical protein [Deltaproteobacteria bacterium]